MPQRLEWTIDVNAPLNTIQTPTLLMQGDDQANTFAVRVTNKGRSYDLSGYTVSAWVERRDGVRVPVDGTVEGNVAEVTLTESCYRVSGRYIAFVRITNAETGEKRTILRLTGLIENEGNGPVLDEEDVIPSLEELLAQIAAMEQATEAANAAANNANAAAADAVETATEAADNANRVAQTVQDKLDNGELNGKGFEILGYFALEGDLTANVTSPEPGDAYGVGTTEPYDVYVWDAVNARWVNNGPIQGPKGESGVYVGSDTPPDGYDVWIDPQGKESGLVSSVNGKAGEVELDANDVGALPQKIDGVQEPMLIITDAQGNVIASKTFSGDLVINGTLTATKVIGAVYA